ncbi:MAG: hypothetical protein H6940_03140 [Burkholderiales bacterium]|nr:hypothetical protein [Burkholderiales bacterium]
MYTSIQQQQSIEQFAQWQVTIQYQQDTQPLAVALQQRLQQHQFKLSEPKESTDSTATTNTITYAPGSRGCRAHPAQSDMAGLWRSSEFG